ncbi:hypothetical protein [Paenibacillus wulumuqiensis]|uniref:hypothetical protein n=1 Tax=Paenibacillus wulumuqiensis TaxID=1567107 RepID=UPI000A53540F|nr:hypothetical protein [Paenibacillus wulumuqiensis]
MAEQAAVGSYRKEQFMQSTKFTQLEKDVLSGLLEEDKPYTIEQATSLLHQFMNKEAN